MQHRLDSFACLLMLCGELRFVACAKKLDYALHCCLLQAFVFVHSVFFSHSSNMTCFSAANSLEFQAKQQIKPYQEENFVLEFVGDETHRSRKRKFVLACSDFRCQSCDSSPLRCYSCLSLTNVATKKYRETRKRILFVLWCFANKKNKERPNSR